MKKLTLLIATPAFLAAFALCSATAQAANIAWWRMGDSDTAPVVDNVTGNDLGGGTFFGAGSGIVDEYGGDNDLFRAADTVDYRYSDDVPGSAIYDPLTDTYSDNTWSAYSGSPGARPQGNNTTPHPPAATLETFVKFTELEDGVSGVDFLYGLSNSSGGFRVQSFADGSIQIQIKEEDGGGDGPYTTFTSAAGFLEAGTWHRIGLVMAPDASGDDDIFVYVDGQAAISANYTNDDEMPASGFPILIGSVFSTEGSGAVPILYDETRYFSHALSPSEFLQAVPEPTSVGIAVLGALALAGLRRRKM